MQERQLVIPYVRRSTTHVLLVDDRETVGEVKGLALGDHGGDFWPCCRLRSIRQEVHDDRALANCLGDVEQGLSWNPAVFLGLLP